MSRQPPDDKPGRRGAHVAGVLEALRGFFGDRTRPEGRTNSGSASSGRLAQRSDHENKRPDRPCGPDEN